MGNAANGTPRDYVMLLPSLRNFGFPKKIRVHVLHHLLRLTEKMSVQDMAQTASEVARMQIPQVTEAMATLGQSMAARLDESLSTKPGVLATYLRACSSCERRGSLVHDWLLEVQQERC